MRNLKQILIWLKRFRYRCGYGVHSPFAFDFITNVIYENTSYYAYEEIERIAKETKVPRVYPRRVNRLLFRLVNYIQPQTIVSTTTSNMTSTYLQSAKRTAMYVQLTPEGVEHLSLPSSLGFLHIDCAEDVTLTEQYAEYGIARVGASSMIVLQGIYRSAEMKAYWERLVADERVGITFDLYELGILFFDKSKIKQHYIVNF